MTSLVEAPDFYRLFLFVGAFCGLIASGVSTLYVYRTIRKERDLHGASSDRRLMLALYRLSGLDNFVLFYFTVYFLARLYSEPSVSPGAIYYLAVAGYTLALFALALPGISAAFVARSLNRARPGRGRRRIP